MNLKSRYNHFRIHDYCEFDEWGNCKRCVPSSCGGITICRIIDEDTKEIIAWGISFCSPRDNFSRKTGRAIAEGRALKAIEEAKMDPKPQPRLFAGIGKPEDINYVIDCIPWGVDLYTWLRRTDAGWEQVSNF